MIVNPCPRGRTLVDVRRHGLWPLGRMAWGPVVAAALAMGVVLTVYASAYGYHRDELYFRMLPPATGYLDQPGLTPWLARLTRELVADEPWALRLPATACAVASVLVIAAITRELGGDRAAQTLSAWGYAFAAAPLMLGHLLLSSSVDLVLLPAIVWAVLRTHRAPRAWLLVGGLVGLATFNRWIVVVLVAGLTLGLVAVGPREPLRSPWLWAGAALALVVATPNIAYQVTHDLPQLAMGDALRENNADEVRVLMWPMLALLLGPPLVPIWVAGVVALVRREEWRFARWLVVAFGAVIAFTWWGGAQVHYLMAVLPTMYAAGCVPVASWVRDRPAWRRLLLGAVAINAAVAIVIGLPVIPVGQVAATPVSDVSPLVGDTVGWPAYARQVAAAREAAGGPDVPVLTTNYGEAGAIARFGPALGLTAVFSGHNELWHLGPPPDAPAVLVVGAQVRRLRTLFTSCTTVGRLDNGEGVDNEEQGQPLSLCSGPRAPWSEQWREVRHLD